MSFAGHSLQTIIVRVGLILLALAAGVLHARCLGPEGVGIIALVVLVKNFTFRYGNLGFGSAFAYFVANQRCRMNQMIRLNWVISIALAAVSIAILLLLWQQPFSPWNELTPSIFHLALMLVPLFFINMHSQRILSGKLKIGIMNIANLINGIANVLGLVGFVVIMKYGVAGAVWALILAELLTLVYLACNSRHIQRFPDHENRAAPEMSSHGLVKQLWRYGRWNYLLSFVNFLIEELPLMVLTQFVQTIGAVGIFSKARELGRQSRTISIPISQVLFPYTAASEPDKAIKRTNAICRTYLVFLCLMMAVAIPLIKPVIRLLYGAEFLPAATLFYYLVPGMIVWPLGNFMTIHVAAAGRPKQVFFWNLIPLTMTVTMTLILIPKYQLTGAAAATSGILIFLTLIRFLMYRHETGASFRDVFIIRRSDLSYARQIFMRSLPDNRSSADRGSST